MENYMKIKEQMDNFYFDNDIHPKKEFKCKHKTECKRGCSRFERARMGMLGVEYGSENLPKVLVIGLDPQLPKKNNTDEDREFHLQERVDDKIMEEWPKNWHWSKTHKLLLGIFQYLNPELRKLSDVSSRFAFTNAAKCKGSINDKNDNNDKVRFKNCREYLKAEIEIFNPDVLWSQGIETIKSIEKVFRINSDNKSRCNKPGHTCEWSELELSSGKLVLCLKTYHPNSYPKYWDAKQSGYIECYGSLLKEMYLK